MPDISVGEIERFLVDEAALLDEWRLAEWLALFAEAVACWRVSLPLLTTGSTQLVEQRLCLFELGHVEAFGEPAVDRRDITLCRSSGRIRSPTSSARG